MTGGEEPAPEPDPAPPEAPSVVSACVVLGLAVGVFGVSFGVLAVAAGLSPVQACAMSLLVFTGASQFAAVGVVGTGGSIVAALAGALLLAARNGGYGLALAKTLPGSLASRLLAAQLVIDESAGMALAQDEPRRRVQAFWAAGVSVFVFWNLGTLLGALGGSAIGDPLTYGLDAAFPAGFVVLLVPHLRTADGKLAAALGAAIALVTIPLLPAGMPVLAAGLAVLVGLRGRPPHVDRGIAEGPAEAGA